MRKEIFRIEGMHCAACSAAVERVTRKLPGVSESSVNLMTEKLTITFDEQQVTIDDIVQKVEKAGFHAILLQDKPKAPTPPTAKKEDSRPPYRLILSLALAACLLYASMGSMLFPSAKLLPDIFSMHTHPVNHAILQMMLAGAVMALSADRYKSGIKALFHLSPNMDSLVAMGSLTAYIYSFVLTLLIQEQPHLVHSLFYEAAAVVVALVSLGKTLEEAGKRRTAGAIRALATLLPDETTRLLPDGSLEKVALDALREGDIVLLRAGERIPADGEVISGEGGADESMLTGESLPVEKTTGSAVTGGSVVVSGALQVRLQHVGQDTALAAIIRFVEDAQSKKAPIARLADKIAGVFVPAVLGIALVASVIWGIAGQDISFILRIFTSVLVIACPCAMGLATPTAVAVGTGLGAQNGILVRSGEALERAHSINTVVFDKTGTVTLGKPQLTLFYTESMTEEDRLRLLSLAAAAENASAHPLALALKKAAEEKGIATEQLGAPQSFRTIPGGGICAVFTDGHTILLGNRRLLATEGVAMSPGHQEAAEAHEKTGGTAIFMAEDHHLLAVFGIADPIKPTAQAAIEALHKQGIEVHLLTGDSQAAADHVAQKISADCVKAGVLPEEKADYIASLKKNGRQVMMVGDGINDAPSLAAADIGCALGSGTDVAMESADIVLMKSELLDVPRALRLSRLTIRNIKQNLFWAFFYNTVGIPVAAGVLYPAFGLLLNPMIGALAMSLSSLFVVSNALRLRLCRLDVPGSHTH